MSESTVKAAKKRKVYGLYDPETVIAVNRLLKHEGLKLRVKKDYRNWGDQIEITIEKVADEQTAELRNRLESAELELTRLRELETAAAEVYIRRDDLFPVEENDKTDAAMRELWRRVKQLGWYFPKSAYDAFKFERDKPATGEKVDANGSAKNDCSQ